MATLTRATDASMDTSQAFKAVDITGLIAGEDLPAVCPCRIGSDGLVYRASGAAANANAKVRGFTPRAAKSGQAITLFREGRFRYASSGLTPSTDVFLSATTGALDDAATTGGTTALGFTINSTDIIVRVP